MKNPDYQTYENLVSKTVDMYIFSTTIPPKTKQQIQYKEFNNEFVYRWFRIFTSCIKAITISN